jgi:hypothetical protein
VKEEGPGDQPGFSIGLQKIGIKSFALNTLHQTTGTASLFSILWREGTVKVPA